MGFVEDALLALVLCVCWTSMYNVSVYYDIMEQLIIAFSMAYTVSTEGLNLWNWIVIPLTKATPDLQVIIPLILGVLYFSILYRPLARVFRVVVTMNVALNLALAFAGAGVTQVATLTGFAYMKTWTAIIPFILYLAGLFYLTFSAKLSKLSTTIGQLGRFGIFTFFAVTCYGNLFCGLIQSTGYINMMLTGSAWFIVPIIFVLVLLNALGVYKKLGWTFEKPVTPTAQT